LEDIEKEKSFNHETKLKDIPKVMALFTKLVIENKVDRVKRNIQYPTVRIQGIETLPDTF
jgi:hypothetical protein